ncbi:hypothetical protein HPB52_014255 [Rhipicephalus sanguineus]|uniref:Uncharacterized protein n=1 Tax=Rhipicephalus sanguineus TaxID=34632 RepID=A0A9D4QF45_RHISA|nr:hypothetical protein HPB52_014255 [Rhipicephalus sanguineus]
MASLKQNSRRRGFSEGRFQATHWLSRGALFKRAFPSLPLAGATDTSFFFLCVGFSAVAVRLCAPAFAIVRVSRRTVFPLCAGSFSTRSRCLETRLKPSTQRAFGSRKKRAWNKKAPTTSAPSAAELESRPDPLDLPGTSTDDTVGPSSTSETLRVDAAYYSTAEQAQRVERSAQTKTVLSGKSATQRKFDLRGVSAERQTGDAGTDFLLVDMKVLNNFFAQAKCNKCDAKSLSVSVRKATDKEYGLAHRASSCESLLARCCEGKTQNASESLHSVIWTQTSKNGNASLESVKRAAAEAVAIYNQGRRATNESIAATIATHTTTRSRPNTRAQQRPMRRMPGDTIKEELVQQVQCVIAARLRRAYAATFKWRTRRHRCVQQS